MVTGKWQFVLIPLFLLLINSLLAVELKMKKMIMKDGRDNFILESDDPHFLERQYQAIKAWKFELGEEGVFTEDTVNKRGWNYFRSRWDIDITRVMPERLKLQQICMIDFKKDGPNCWSSALASNSILDNYYFINSDLFHRILNSPWCRERGIDEELRPGDIVAIRQKGGEEVHGAVFLNDHLVFTKNGYTAEKPYQFQLADKMLSEYGVKINGCKRQLSSNPDSSCPYYANYYYCNKKPIKNIFFYYQPYWIELEKMAVEMGDHCLHDSFLNKQNIVDRLDLFRKMFENNILNTKNPKAIMELQLLLSLVQSLFSALNYI